VRAAVVLGEDNGFSVASSMDITPITLYNEKGNSLAPYFSYSMVSELAFGYFVCKTTEPNNIFILDPSSPNNRFFSLPGFTRSYFKRNRFIGNKTIYDVSSNGIESESSFTKVGNETGGEPDAYGNTIYTVDGKNIRYIKSSGSILELGTTPVSHWHGVDGHYYIQLDNSRLRVNGKTHTIDSLDYNAFYAAPLKNYNIYLPRHDMWSDRYGYTCNVNDTTKGRLLDVPLVNIIKVGVSNNYYYLLEKVDVGRNKLWKIDPVNKIQRQVATNYDVTDFVVNGDDGGVFYGLNFNTLKSVVCGFHASGSVVELKELQSGESPRLFNLSLADYKIWK
jgi:hypothetical protein